MGTELEIGREKSEDVLQWFRQLAKIPRPSFHEQKVREWLEDWARDRGFASKQDDAGNLLIQVPGTKGAEDAPGVVLQGHMDMVCEKTPDAQHDFLNDPIELVTDGDWLRANKTTLGADNGIAIALAMAVVSDPDATHPPLELLFTVEEETGLTGATKLDPSLFEGQILLNLDSEDEGVLTVGCAGGVNATLSLPLSFVPAPEGGKAYQIKVSGAKGGHSGLDINKGRANAIRLMVQVLGSLGSAVRLAGWRGGTAHNAIPRAAVADVWIEPEAEEQVKAMLSSSASSFCLTYAEGDPGVEVTLAPLGQPLTQVLEEESAKQVVDLVLAMPDGVASMASAIPGLVETSNTIATVAIEEGTFTLLTSIRSSVVSRLEGHLERVAAIARLSGATLTRSMGYPPWEPHWDSPLLAKGKAIYTDLFGKEPKIEVMHAGLECGIIGDKSPGMEMLSLGPTIRNPHSPDECLKISDVGKVYILLTGILKALTS